MEDNKRNHHKSTNFHQQLPPENPGGALTRQDPQYQPVGKNIADLYRPGHGKKEMGMDRANAEEPSGYCHETSFVLEPLREKEKRQAEHTWGSFRCGLDCAVCLYIANGLTQYTFSTGVTRHTTSHNLWHKKRDLYDSVIAANYNT